jgi:putative acetyltransferase
LYEKRYTLLSHSELSLAVRAMIERVGAMISVRLEQPVDATGVRELNDLAFGSPVEGRIVESLRAAPDCISLVAIKNDLVVGHILFTPVSLTPPAGLRVAGLGPMSVLPEHQRAGIGGQLIRAGLEACREHGYSAVVVVGHPEYYPRFGFEPAHTRGLTLPDFDVPQEVFMVVELHPGVREHLNGAVRYRAEFAEA